MSLDWQKEIKTTQQIILKNCYSFRLFSNAIDKQEWVPVGVPQAQQDVIDSQKHTVEFTLEANRRQIEHIKALEAKVEQLQEELDETHKNWTDTISYYEKKVEAANHVADEMDAIYDLYIKKAHLEGVRGSIFYDYAKKVRLALKKGEFTADERIKNKTVLAPKTLSEPKQLLSNGST